MAHLVLKISQDKKNFKIRIILFLFLQFFFFQNDVCQFYNSSYAMPSSRVLKAIIESEIFVVQKQLYCWRNNKAVDSSCISVECNLLNINEIVLGFAIKRLSVEKIVIHVY